MPRPENETRRSPAYRIPPNSIAHLRNSPVESRQIADLLYYHDLSQAEASAALGIPLRTLKRRWQQIRLEGETECHLLFRPAEVIKPF